MLYRSVKESQSYLILPSALNLLIVLYSLILLGHYFLLPDAYRLNMIVLAVFTISVTIAFRVFVNRSVISDNPTTVFSLLILLTAANSLVHIQLSGDIRQTTNLIFILAICGYLILNTAIFIAICATVLALWIWSVWALPYTDATAHFGFALVFAEALAIFAHTSRLKFVNQLVENQKTLEALNRSQQQLETSESALRAFIEFVPAGVLIRNIKAEIIAVNSRALELLNFDKGSIPTSITDTKWALYHPDGREMNNAELPINEVISTGEPITQRIAGLKDDNGKMTWCLLNGFPYEGTVEDRLFAFVFVDITERIDAERQLKESEHRTQIVLNSIADGVIAVNENGIITHFNEAAQFITSLTLGDTIGRDYHRVLQFSAAENPIGETPLSDNVEHAHGILKTVRGDEIIADMLNSRIIDNKGHILGQVYTFRDLSDEIRIEEERARLDKLNSIGLLAGGIAHDFNNLLTAIYGNISLAQTKIEHDNQNEEAIRFLDKAAGSIQQATHLSRQLLTFSGSTEPRREKIDFADLVQDVARFCLAGSSVTVTYEIATDLWLVNGDPGQLHQAVSNLLINAKQAMNDNGVINIALNNLRETDEHPGFISIEISDTGPGISMEFQDKIFDPYFTTRSDGTGLGLTTTHSIISKHGGSITVESSAGNGTHITVLLPAYTEINDEEPGLLQESDEVNERLSILVLDDEDAVRQIVVELVEFLGHSTVETRTGEEAIVAYKARFARGEPFDLAIMDLTIAGGMGGAEAAQRILEFDPSARLIVASGYSAENKLSEYLKTGFCDLLAKPFRSDQLRRTINRVMAVNQA